MHDQSITLKLFDLIKEQCCKMVSSVRIYTPVRIDLETFELLYTF